MGVKKTMKTIQFNEIYSMNDSDKIFVSKDAIYIQILDYEKNYRKQVSCELVYLTKIIADLFDFECRKMLQRQRVEMTVLEIKTNFNPHNYYPKTSFVQYIPTNEDDE